MSTLAKLVVKLITDVSEFESGMKNAIKKVDQIGTSMQKIGDKMTLGVTLPLAAMGTAAVKMASDLSESMNKVDVVFGDTAETIKEWSRNSARSLGMSQNAALQAAGTFGNLFSSMGVGIEKSSEMSMDLTQLAADLASFNNLDPAEALLKLQSGIVGQAEPLRALGVNLTEAAVKAKAMEMGLVGAGGQMDEQAKIMARYALIMEQTQTAQGDFARTSDGLANSTRILRAEFENTLASFGTVLLPVATEFMRALIPILEWFNGLSDGTKKAIVYFAMFASALGPVLSVGGRFVQLGAAFMKLFGKTGPLAKGIPFLTKLLPKIGGVFKVLGPFFAGLIPKIGGMGTALGGLATTAGAMLGPVLAVAVAIGVLIVTVMAFGKQAWGTVKNVMGILGMLPKYWSIKAKEAWAAIGQVDWDQVFTNAYQGLLRFDTNVGDRLNQAADKFGGFIDRVRSFNWNSIPRSLIAVLQGAGSAVGNWLQGLTARFGQFLQGVAASVPKHGQAIVNGLTNTLRGIGTAIGNGLNTGLRAIGNWITSFYYAGQRLMSGFVAGIASWATNLVQTVMRVVQTVIDTVQNMLGIHSDSKLFTQFGRNLMGGLAGGIDDLSMKPALATARATGAVAAASAMIPGGAGGLSFSTGPITIYGDLSESQKEALKKEFGELFEDAIVEAFKAAGGEADGE